LEIGYPDYPLASPAAYHGKKRTVESQGEGGRRESSKEGAQRSRIAAVPQPAAVAEQDGADGGGSGAVGGGGGGVIEGKEDPL